MINGIIITECVPTIKGRLIKETNKYMIYKLSYGYAIVSKGKIGYWITRLYTTRKEIKK